ncbi:SUN domain-containing protein 2-like [Diorhabda sublineata]|uniref:SUN domain-containing protein 2-like n=1 Tax=Diorhabda sublineata TaxID=1163346 RepID=UPI0024E11DAA|nr:SUN domain-containing protein 2-like [Diorhabda sublineata]
MKREQETMRRNIRKSIQKELEKYSWDKTGRTDFALETSGGRIVRLSKDTENFDASKSILGITLCEGMHGPRAMLQADMSPGHCWALKGSSGGVVIKLLGKIKINAVTIEHIPENMSPTLDIQSAPKDFEIWGIKDVNEKGEYIGRFTFKLNGQSIQTFDINQSNFYSYIEFRVLTNHNNPDYTCVYRLRVHGILAT